MNSVQNDLKKKLSIFVGIVIVFSVLMLCTGTSLFEAICFGIIAGCLFYIPGRIKGLFGFGILMTILISLVYIVVMLWAMEEAIIIGVLLLLFPLVDIGYSVYLFMKNKQ